VLRGTAPREPLDRRSQPRFSKRTHTQRRGWRPRRGHRWHVHHIWGRGLGPFDRVQTRRLTVAIYGRDGGNPFIRRVRTIAAGTIDAVTGTDGLLDVATQNPHQDSRRPLHHRSSTSPTPTTTPASKLSADHCSSPRATTWSTSSTTPATPTTSSSTSPTPDPRRLHCRRTRRHRAQVPQARQERPNHRTQRPSSGTLNALTKTASISCAALGL
jgi:hypothetical protein